MRSFIQSEDGAERALNVYGPGSLFGEASFFDELPRVSSAVALTSCEIVAIDRELVTEEIEKDPELALAMMKYLARTVRLLSTQLDQMAFRRPNGGSPDICCHSPPPAAGPLYTGGYRLLCICQPSDREPRSEPVGSAGHH